MFSLFYKKKSILKIIIKFLDLRLCLSAFLTGEVKAVTCQPYLKGILVFIHNVQELVCSQKVDQIFM